MTAHHSLQSNCRTVFLSDIHLGFKDCKADFLLDFLNQTQCERIYLLGDVVDIWSLKSRVYWPASHQQVLCKLLELAKSGIEIIYIPGNHDEEARAFIDTSISEIQILEDHIHETADGKQMLLIHGDILDANIRFNWIQRVLGDWSYDLLLFLNRWMNRLRRLAGHGYWSLAAYLKNRIGNARSAIDLFEQAAVKEAQRRGLDGVICGHIHQPEIRYFGDMLYANDGDWIENCTALIEDYSGNLELLHWSDRQFSLKTLVTNSETDVTSNVAA